MNSNRKLFRSLVLLTIVIFTGMQNINAQVNIKIYWSLECPHIWTTQEDCHRVFVYSIYEVCDDSPALVCADTATFNCETSSPVTVQCNYDCSGSHEDLCFRINVDAYKVCIGPGGSNIICYGTGRTDVGACSDLMNTTPEVYITWQ